MSLESAKEFWERTKRDPAFHDEVFKQGGGILEHMDRIKDMGYDFTKEEIHQVVVAPNVLEKMNKAAVENVEMTKELMDSFFYDCKSAKQLSDDELDQVAGGINECKQCHEDDR